MSLQNVCKSGIWSIRNAVICVILIKVILIASIINYISRPGTTAFFSRNILRDVANNTKTQHGALLSHENVLAEGTRKYFSQYVPECPSDERLVGFLKIDLDFANKWYLENSNVTERDLEEHGSTFLGHYKERIVTESISSFALLLEPANCIPPRSVAFIIPFRYRETHLKLLLGHLVPILQRQFLRYSIFVINQFGNGTFNKGRLMNTGFEIATQVGKARKKPFDCYIFHDVDLLAEYDTLEYSCPGGSGVLHLSTTIDKFDYRPLCCGITVGGVLGFTEEQFRKVNGYSNEYWGWGGEDDDMYGRIKNQKFWVSRPDATHGRYTMLSHEKDEGNPTNNVRHESLKNGHKRTVVAYPYTMIW